MQSPCRGIKQLPCRRIFRISPIETDTLIVGAGPAGLAMGAALRRSGRDVPFAIIDRADTVASAWRSHYDRLHLHTARDYSSLPYLPFPSEYPQYVPRLKVVEYLDAYAKAFDLAPRLGEEVVSIRRQNSGFETRTRKDTVYRSQRAVLATGYNRAPVRPRWPGDDAFRGPIVHSSQYKSGAAYRGKRVLVVGIGNTGGEIAIDLHEHGAEPSISVRSPVVVVPRDFLGQPVQRTAILMEYLPIGMRNWIGRAVSRLAFGDLEPIGFGRPTIGPSDLIARGRIPLIDVGTIDLVRRGLVKIVPDVERFTEAAVRFRDGREVPFDAVILATGYRPALEDFLELNSARDRVIDERGYPRGISAGDACPGLFFLGFVNPATGFLRQIALDSVRIAGEIASAAQPV
jgi:indole-3-pyruvate monooxygenase